MKSTLSILFLCGAALAIPSPATPTGTPATKKFRVGLQSKKINTSCHETGKCLEWSGDKKTCINEEQECDGYMADNWFTYTLDKTTEPQLCLTDPSGGKQEDLVYYVENFALDDKSPFQGLDLTAQNAQAPWPHGHFDLGWCAPGVPCYYEANGANAGVLMIGGKANPCNKIEGGNTQQSDPLYTWGSTYGCSSTGAHRRNVIECAFT